MKIKISKLLLSLNSNAKYTEEYSYNNSGEYPIIDGSTQNFQYKFKINTFDYDNDILSISTVGYYAGHVNIYNGKCSIGNNVACFILTNYAISLGLDINYLAFKIFQITKNIISGESGGYSALNINKFLYENKIRNTKLDILNKDTLKVSKYNGKIDFVLGNPPYVRVHNLNNQYEEVKKYLFSDNGMTDLYITFYEIGLKMLKKNGTLCYITPNSFCNSLAAKKLREYIKDTQSMELIMDLGHYQPFNVNTYTCICKIVNNSKFETCKYYKYDIKTGNKEFISNIKYSDLFIDNNIILSSNNQKFLPLLRYKSKNKILVKNGFATLNDKVFIQNKFPFKENQIDVIKGSTSEWKKCIYPYDKDGKLIPFEDLDKEVQEYLNNHKKDLIKENKKYNLYKGAPEVLLPKCDYFYDEKTSKKNRLDIDEINQKLKEYTRSGFRILCLAVSDRYRVEEFSHLTLIGFILLKDEVRKEAIDGIRLVENAGVQTVMITGDNKDTALSIGREVGLIKKDTDLVLTSNELNGLSDEEVKKKIPFLRIVARSLPQDKSRLVRLSEEMGFVVGMTGDGVNDAPALKKADVGFAMGSGTEVAKEASEIVILDDNFLSISKAILFGRTIFKSIRKFIIFQLTVNLCAIFLSIIGPFIGIDTPVTVIQMLWINMIMDTLAGIAFAYEPPLLEYMKEKPKSREEPIMNSYMKGEILFTGAYSAFLCVFFLKSPWISSFYRVDPNQKYLMTAFFGLFIFMGIFNCFNARTERLNLVSNIWWNRAFVIIILFIVVVQLLLIYFGGSLFRTFGLTLRELVIMLALSSTVIPVDWIRKIVLKRKGKIA